MHTGKAAWFCIRSRPKHEHIAAAHLRQMPGVEVFNPQLRFVRATKRGNANVVESLFPNYLFARFVPHLALDKIRYTCGVTTVVSFGDRIPSIPDEVIEELQQSISAAGHLLFSDAPEAGEEVEITKGPFQGEYAIVARVLPARQRVQILLDVLGRPTSMELSLEAIYCRPRTPATLVLASA